MGLHRSLPRSLQLTINYQAAGARKAEFSHSLAPKMKMNREGEGAAHTVETEARREGPSSGETKREALWVKSETH